MAKKDVTAYTPEMMSGSSKSRDHSCSTPGSAASGEASSLTRLPTPYSDILNSHPVKFIPQHPDLIRAVFHEMTEHPSRALKYYDKFFHYVNVNPFYSPSAEGGQIAFEELKIDFIISRLSEGKVISKRTFQSYIGDLKYSREYLEHIGLTDCVAASEFNHETMKKFTLYLRGCQNHRNTMNGLENKTIHRILATHISMLKHGNERGYIHFANFTDPKSFKNIKFQKNDRQPYTPDQLIAFVQAIPDTTFQARRDMAFFTLILSTGLRLDEALNLKTWQLVFETAGFKSRGKNGTMHNVLLDKWCGDIMKKYMHERDAFLVKKGILDDKDFLFISAKGKSAGRKVASRTMERCLEKYGMKTKFAKQEKFMPHRIRHTFATYYLINGGSVHDLQMILGHKDIATTMHYVHLARFIQLIFKRISILNPGEVIESEGKKQWDNSMRELHNLLRKKFGLPPNNFDDGLAGGPVSA